MQSYDRRFILTTLTGKSAADIIAPANSFDDNNIVGYLRQNNISFIVIDADEAAKLALADGGIGVGCYVPATSEHINESRKMLSEIAYRHLSQFVGIVSIAPPVEVEVRVQVEPEMELA